MTVPKAWFTHFYVFGAVVNAAGLYVLWLKMMPVEACAKASQRLTFEVQLSAVLFELHLIRRAVECYTVHSFQGSQMHALVYVLGLAHYVLVALTFATEGCEHAIPTLPQALQLMTVRHAAGIALFVVGNLEQNRAHKHLASLRAPTAAATAAGGYSLPTEGWFQQIDCPHYFWEIMIYSSLIVLTAAQAPGLMQYRAAHTTEQGARRYGELAQLLHFCSKANTMFCVDTLVSCLLQVTCSNTVLVAITGVLYMLNKVTSSAAEAVYTE
eukprot:7625-Heterococcus_DN1.PRE.1